MSIIVALDGVQRDHHGEQVYEGLKLFHALSQSYRVVISTDFSGAEAERWCRIHGVTEYGDILDASSALPDQPLRLRHVDLVRAGGSRVEFLVDVDTANVTAAAALGIPVLLFARPKPTKPEFSTRTWDEITAVVERSKEMAAGLDPKVERYE